MLSHHLGTKTFQGDFTFCNSSLTRQQIINKMQLLKPSQNFRQSYGYCNSRFLTAGERMQYMDNDEWLITYNHPAFGIFPIKFKIWDNT